MRSNPVAARLDQTTPDRDGAPVSWAAPPHYRGRAERVMARCDALAACTEEPESITRRYGSPALSRAMTLVEGWMREAGLQTRRDAIGNLLGSTPTRADAATRPLLVLGSHLDSVRDAGKYDGPLGVLTALDAAEAIAGSSDGLEVAAFADEEGVRFHTAYLGSRAYSGTFDPSLLDLVDREGQTLRGVCAAFGGDPEALAQGAHQSPRTLRGYVEVHIEQGPSLERVGQPLGVVTAIAAQTRIAATFRGAAGHAGTVAMAFRRDALLGAAELALAAEHLAQTTPDLVATVGELTVAPGVSNVISGQAIMSLDVRSPVDAVITAATTSLQRTARLIAERRQLGLDWEVVQQHPSVAMDANLAGRLDAAVATVGLQLHRLPSGAGHDAVALAPVCPVAMLFVRCRAGISHNPAEAVTTEDVAAALAVLDRFLAEAMSHPESG